jgi:hypothetical protein
MKSNRKGSLKIVTAWLLILIISSLALIGCNTPIVVPSAETETSPVPAPTPAPQVSVASAAKVSSVGAMAPAALAGYSSSKVAAAEASGAPAVYDYDGNLHSMDWLRAEFGNVTYTRTEVPAGAAYIFRVVALRAKCGPAALVIKVIDEDGANMEGIAIVRHWPGAPKLPDFSDSTAKQWTTHGISGKTNYEGDVGFGMGGGDYYWPDREDGVSSVYVADFAGYGDLVSGLGMIAATEHCHVDTTFQRIPAESAGPNPTPDPGPGSGGWDVYFSIIVDGAVTPRD